MKLFRATVQSSQVYFKSRILSQRLFPMIQKKASRIILKLAGNVNRRLYLISQEKAVQLHLVEKVLERKK